MTTTGLPEAGARMRASSWWTRSIQLAQSIMAEEVFGRPLIKPWCAFPDGLQSIPACFLWYMKTIPLLFRGPSPN